MSPNPLSRVRASGTGTRPVTETRTPPGTGRPSWTERGTATRATGTRGGRGGRGRGGRGECGGGGVGAGGGAGEPVGDGGRRGCGEPAATTAGTMAARGP